MTQCGACNVHADRVAVGVVQRSCITRVGGVDTRAIAMPSHLLTCSVHLQRQRPAASVMGPAAENAGREANERIEVQRIPVVGDLRPIAYLGMAVNQRSGSVVDGLSTMPGLPVPHENGRVLHTNLLQIPMLRVPIAPCSAVPFAASDYPRTGLGEPALPPLARAV